MKNVFDAHNNYDEWEENDWEYEEYRKSPKREKNQSSYMRDAILVIVVFIVFGIVLPLIIEAWIQSFP